MSHEDAGPLGWCDSCHGLVLAWTSWEPFVSGRGDLLLFCDGCLRRATDQQAERDRIAARDDTRD